jgi:hypothetical protein
VRFSSEEELTIKLGAFSSRFSLAIQTAKICHKGEEPARAGNVPLALYLLFDYFIPLPDEHPLFFPSAR